MNINSAAHIKGLLLNFNTLPIDTRIDLLVSIERIKGQINWPFLYLYIIGYSSSEIASHYELPIHHIENELSKALLILAEDSGYTDIDFMQSIRSKYKYNAVKLSKMPRILNDIFRNYTHRELIYEYS